MIGVDICGFVGVTTKDLCARWIQVGSFYPFSRNHNQIFMPGQELYVFGEDFTKMSIKLLNNRYSLIPYFYSEFWRVHSQGGTVVRPLFFEFPTDQYALRIDAQFLIGKYLLITPVLQPATLEVTGYFPSVSDNKNICYDYYTGKAMENYGFVTIPCPWDEIVVHIRGGAIIPKQKSEMVLRDARNNPFDFLIALDWNGSANGTLFYDNGNQIHIEKLNVKYLFVVFNVTSTSKSSTFSAKTIYAGYAQDKLVGSIKVYGVNFVVNNCQINGVAYHNFVYNDDLKTLDITNIQNLQISSNFNIKWFA